MLDTLLEIGKIFRTSPDGLKHHRYIKKPPPREPENTKAVVGNSIRYFSIPCAADGSFDFGNRREFSDEDLIRDLFYLNYKTSEGDSYKKFVFGDVFRTVDAKTQKDTGGNFLMGTPGLKGFYGINSFLRGEGEAEDIEDAVIIGFRNSFRKQLGDITDFLIAHPDAYLHFDFEGKSWWELEAPMRALNEKMLSELVLQQEGGSGWVLQKFLYKALANDTGRIPNFDLGNAHKCRLFNSIDEVMDLIYVLDFSTKSVIRKGDVKVIVLPRGENLSAKQIEDFFDKKTLGAEQIEKAEERLQQTDFLFVPVVQDVDENIKQFDFIFSKAGGVSSPDVDMLEIAGLEKSRLNDLSKRVRHTGSTLYAQRAAELPNLKKPLLPFSIIQSFLNILGDATTAKKKYHSHLFSVLPKIYSGTYRRDPILLPALIEKTEFNIRNDQANFPFLKWDFYFLLQIQNREGDQMDEIKTSPSYRVGHALGKLARQFSGPKTPIKSFEKNYVGLLSRRITNLPDVMKMGNDIQQKLVMHELSKFTRRDANEFADAANALSASGVRYDKDQCAFGFFESYFAPWTKADEIPNAEIPVAEEN